MVVVEEKSCTAFCKGPGFNQHALSSFHLILPFSSTMYLVLIFPPPPHFPFTPAAFVSFGGKRRISPPLPLLLWSCSLSPHSPSSSWFVKEFVYVVTMEHFFDEMLLFSVFKLCRSNYLNIPWWHGLQIMFYAERFPFDLSDTSALG